MRFASLFGVYAAAVSSLWAVPLGLGVVDKDTEVAVDLSYTNRSDVAAVIGKIETSCDCLKLLATPSKVSPGETVQIPFVYRSANAGSVAISVQVLSAVSGQIIAAYSLHGYVCEKDWFITLASVKAEEPVVYIDTRQKEQFAEVHIPHSLNLPAFVLKTRSDLKSQRVVLVDAGFAPDELLESVRQLRAIGFSRACVLQGGLASWLRAGGAWEGTASTPRLAVALISSADYARASRTGNWNQLETVELSRDTAEAKADWNRLREAASLLPAMGRRTQNLLLMAPSTTSYARVEKEISSDNTSLYYLFGGPSAWTAYRTQQAGLAEKTNQRFEVRPTHGQPIMAGGGKPCGTCGSR